ncbi:MAG: methyltransferase, partial [Campylobacterota bacterium]
MLNFTKEAMLQIITTLKDKLDNLNAKEIVEFEVLNPDTFSSTYAGNIVFMDGKPYLYRGYKSWVDLAQVLHCRMLTPAIKSSNTILIRYEK